MSGLLWHLYYVSLAIQLHKNTTKNDHMNLCKSKDDLDNSGAPPIDCSSDSIGHRKGWWSYSVAAGQLAECC